MPYALVDGFVVWVSETESTAEITGAGLAGSTVPALVLGYETTRESRNQVHDLIDGGIAVVLIPPRPRSGELQLLYPDEADAWGALDFFAHATTYTLTDSSRPGVGMAFVIADSNGVRLELDDDTRDVWVVTVPYQEVLT